MRRELVETWNGLGNEPSLFQTVVLIDAACNHESVYITNLIFPYFTLFFDCIKVFIPCMERPLIFCLCFIYCFAAGINTLMSNSDGSDPYLFLSKDGKVAIRQGRNGRKGVYFTPESASFPLINNMIEVLFPICTLIWSVNNYVFRRGNV